MGCVHSAIIRLTNFGSVEVFQFFLLRFSCDWGGIFEHGTGNKGIFDEYFGIFSFLNDRAFSNCTHWHVVQMGLNLQNTE